MPQLNSYLETVLSKQLTINAKSEFLSNRDSNYRPRS